MNQEQRLLIAAYNDGELDPRQAASAEALIERDAAAQAYWREIQQLDRRLQTAFAPILDEGVPPRMQATLNRHRRHRLGGQYTVLGALAASFVLVAVLLVRHDAQNQQMRNQMQLMKQEIAALKHQTLENVPSGAAGAWVAPAGLTRAEIKPLKTYRTSDNRFCREYEERIVDARGVEIRRGIACREGKGHWSDLQQKPQQGGQPLTGKPSASINL